MGTRYEVVKTSPEGIIEADCSLYRTRIPLISKTDNGARIEAEKAALKDGWDNYTILFFLDDGSHGELSK